MLSAISRGGEDGIRWPGGIALFYSPAELDADLDFQSERCMVVVLGGVILDN